ncbi:MAG: endonuclease/exonuclease/phosphatase family protein [Lysobacterales bacterium]|jgi:3-phytase/alkaline phosphatase D
MRGPLYIFVFLVLLLPEGLGADVRIATFNIAMGFDRPGEMRSALESGQHARLRAMADVLQRVRPDIVLLNEFDFDPATDAAGLLNRNYLVLQQGRYAPIEYPYHFRAPVNTGEDSGLDLDGDGKTGGPGDAWGFGHYSGQYGMLVLSRFPIDEQRSRSFRRFPWSGMPGALRPVNPDGTPFHDEASWSVLRLSSKSHWDLLIETGNGPLHLLASHPTPPVFDGPEDRNGRRNFDEIRFWREYTNPVQAAWIRDDRGVAGGIGPDARFVILGDLNADPFDGDSLPGAIDQLLSAAWIDASCTPASAGGDEAARAQGGVNAEHQGEPSQDTADFNDRFSGNLRVDYVLPSASLQSVRCGIFWPARGSGEPGPAEVSDHRLVWLDIRL